MKKLILRTIIHLLIFTLSIFVFRQLYLYWSGAFEPTPSVGFISTKTQTTIIDLENLEEYFTESEYDFFVSSCSITNLKETTEQLISQEVCALVFDLSEPPSDDFESFLLKQNIPTFFVDYTASQNFFESTDKAWYYESLKNFGGELLGEFIAKEFKNSAIQDLNENLILDYIALDIDENLQSEYLKSALSTSEKYGVYVQNANLIIEGTAQTETEQILDKDQNTVESKDGNGDEKSDEFAQNTPELIPEPEVLISIGTEHALTAFEFAFSNKWLEDDFSPTFTAIVESYNDAKQVSRHSPHQCIVYLDTQYSTNNLFEILCNIIETNIITENTDLILNENGGFTIPYSIW